VDHRLFTAHPVIRLTRSWVAAAKADEDAPGLVEA
jgi:hypothetical protein